MQPNIHDASEPPRTNITGNLVALGPLSRVLIPQYQDWMNDFPTQGSAGYPSRPAPWTDDAIAQWFNDAATDQQHLWFTIYETATWQAIGMCILRDIDMQHRTAEFGITIGARE
ncbi:MAG TPA: N-acetyltransferase, partial [Ktedonobacterales bacterium]|nr:N-acetyltransferase [Ktedonobacterales bacterium]